MFPRFVEASFASRFSGAHSCTPAPQHTDRVKIVCHRGRWSLGRATASGRSAVGIWHFSRTMRCTESSNCLTRATMVLSVLVAFGAVTGASEGIKASQAKARREEHRSRKNNLIVHVPKSSEYSQTLEGRRVVLSGNKVYKYRVTCKLGQNSSANTGSSSTSTQDSTTMSRSATPSRDTSWGTQSSTTRASCPPSATRRPS